LRRRECAKLHHQSESIHNEACVFDFAAFQSVNDNKLKKLKDPFEIKITDLYYLTQK